MRVETDRHSGFCGGVIRAINRAESFLREHSGSNLYSLGSIVHNDAELERLRSLGLVAIDYDDLSQAQDAGGHTLLIRAHGEPPATYLKARALGFEIVDCTCPVVLDLQKSIREAYVRLCSEPGGGTIVIFGQPGHAEVLGLMGQATGAVVVKDMAMLLDAVESGKVDTGRPVEIFSQTTKNPAEYAAVCAFLEEKMGPLLRAHNTICTQVASRQSQLVEFAQKHDVVIFVSGKDSSNGKVLCGLCKSANIRTFHIESAQELRPEWFRADDNVGVCGATSTPRWLLEQVASGVLDIDKNFPNFAL